MPMQGRLLALLVQFFHDSFQYTWSEDPKSASSYMVTIKNPNALLTKLMKYKLQEITMHFTDSENRERPGFLPGKLTKYAIIWSLICSLTLIVALLSLLSFPVLEIYL